jgi:hypothetical protein
MAPRPPGVSAVPVAASVLVDEDAFFQIDFQMVLL